MPAWLVLPLALAYQYPRDLWSKNVHSEPNLVLLCPCGPVKISLTSKQKAFVIQVRLDLCGWIDRLSLEIQCSVWVGSVSIDFSNNTDIAKISFNSTHSHWHPTSCKILQSRERNALSFAWMGSWSYKQHAWLTYFIINYMYTQKFRIFRHFISI